MGQRELKMTLKLPPEFQAQLSKTPRTSNAERVTESAPQQAPQHASLKTAHPVDPFDPVIPPSPDIKKDDIEEWDDSKFEKFITPKMRLKEYILATVATESNTEFSFVHAANNMNEVQAFIHKMRVALYRQRLLLKNSGRKAKRFGMKVKSIELSDKQPYDDAQEFIVTLSTVTPPKVHSETSIDKVLQNLLKED